MNKISVRFLQAIDSWIFYPKQVIISVSDDNTNFKEIKILEISASKKDTYPSIQVLKTEFLDTYCRYIKIVAKNIGTCPNWHKGAGRAAWLFADEITVQ